MPSGNTKLNRIVSYGMNMKFVNSEQKLRWKYNKLTISHFPTVPKNCTRKIFSLFIIQEILYGFTQQPNLMRMGRILKMLV